MLHFVIRKIQNKKWLTICLVLGLTFLVAAVACQPMFKGGSLDKMLLDTFEKQAQQENQYPTVIGRSGSYKTQKYDSVSKVLGGIHGYRDVWNEYLSEIDILSEQVKISMKKEGSQGSYGSKGNYLSVSYMPQILAHIDIATGVDYQNKEGIPQGCIAAILPESVMDNYEITVGETLTFTNWKNSKDQPLKLYITGIFHQKDNNDLFWYMRPNESKIDVFVDEADMDYVLQNYEAEQVYYSFYEMLDYRDINHKNAENIQYYLNEFKSADEKFFESCNDLLISYLENKKTVNITLWVLEIPMLGLVLAFIYMVTGQIVESERGEIAMLKSRGFKKIQIVKTYALQGLLLGLLSLLFGVPLGIGLCKLAASTTDFLTFSGSGMEMYHFTPWMLLYGLVAALIGIVFILIPVVIHSRVSIVQQKSDLNINKKMLWERWFLDIVLLFVSLYLLRNFNQKIDKIQLDALQGTKMDPLIFMDSILFIIAMGLFVLRVVHILVKFIYRIGSKRWKPAVYASFLQISRNFRKQGFISVFLILTVALGLFNANAARTINKNHENRIVYENGADLTLQETWQMRMIALPDFSTNYEYIEPDALKYEALVKDGTCMSMTRVMRTSNTIVSKSGKQLTDCEIMGIHTKEFGQTAYLQQRPTDKEHWFENLNRLAKKESGVIISENLAKELEVKVGDRINCVRLGDITSLADTPRGAITAEVVAIVDAWPGYEQYQYSGAQYKENYLVVMNLAKMIQCFKTAPYEIWYKLADGTSAQSVLDNLQGQGVQIEHASSIQARVDDMKKTAMIRITNGMFTLSFLIAIILCMVGFLIYWISSIRQRELLFGVYRAMGLSEKEVNRMLVNEHLFSTLPSVISGFVCGACATWLFVRLFAVIYLPQKHNLALTIYFQFVDAAKLLVVIAVMIILCVVVLRRLIRALNITQALKLGEE